MPCVCRCERTDARRALRSRHQASTPGCKSLKRLRYEDRAQFVIASLLLEVRASDGSEIDGHDGQPGAQIASGWNSAEEFRRSF